MSRLTPSIRHQSTAGFPVFGTDDDGKPCFLPSATDTLAIDSCAELMSYNVPGSRYGTPNGFNLLHDLQGQPMILSVGTDQKLYLCAYIDSGRASWKTFDITPSIAGSSFQAQLCDASNSPDNKNILIAVSGHDSQSKARKLYHAVLRTPRLAAGDVAAPFYDEAGNPFTATSWQETTTGSKMENRAVDTLVCQYYGREVKHRILAGVAATSTVEGSHFIYSPVSSKWDMIKFPVQTERIRSLVPANLTGLGAGHLVLLEDASVTTGVSCLFRGDGVAKQFSLAGLENPTRVFASMNSMGTTDVLIAAENGIGFIDSAAMLDQGTAPLVPRVLLGGISVRNVLGYERAVDRQKSVIAILAVSTDGDLYLLQGTRPGVGGMVDFPPKTPLPIRDHVRNVAGRINSYTGAFEVVYSSKGSNDSLKMISQDPVTTLWKESDIIVKGNKPADSVKIKAFVVNVSLSNGKGESVPPGYSVQLKSAPTLAYINGMSYNLSSRLQKVSVNKFGQLEIVIPAEDSLAAAAIELLVPPSVKDETRGAKSEMESFLIQPAQSVLHKMSQFSTVDGLKNATTSDGVPFFSDAQKQALGSQGFDDAARIFAQLPAMLTQAHAGDSGIARMIPPEVNDAVGTLVAAWEKDGPAITEAAEEWLSEASDATAGVLGDAIELLKSRVKTGVKVVLKVAAPGLALLLKYAGKWIRFSLDTSKSVVDGLSYFLEDILGVDLSGVRDLFTFRYQRVEATRKEIADIINGGLDLTARFLHNNHDMLEKMIDCFGKYIETFITRSFTKQDSSSSQSSTILSSILNNPVITALLKFNPLTWISEAAAEELGDDYKIPPLDFNISGQILSALKENLNLLLGFLERSWAGIQAAIGQPQFILEELYKAFRDGFRTLFKAVKNIILAIYDLVMNSFDAIKEFCRAIWKVPTLTDLWTTETGVDFTLVNFVSYVAAQVLEIPNTTKTPILSGLGLSTVMTEIRNTDKLPRLLPQKLIDDMDAYNAAPEGYYEDLLAEGKRDQERVAAYMAANPVTTPRFGLMANDGYLEQDGNPKKPEKPAKRPSPPVAAQYILAFARSGKAFARPATVAVEGIWQGAATAKAAAEKKAAGRAAAEAAAPAQPHSEQVNELLEYLDRDVEGTGFMEPARPSTNDGWDVSDITRKPTQDSFSYSFLLQDKPQVPQGQSPASVLVGINVFGFACRVVEQVMLLVYYDDAENHAGLVLELAASLVGTLIAIFADQAPIMAVSNLFTSVGDFAGQCMAQGEGSWLRRSDMIGASMSAAASVLFLVKEPEVQGVAWVGACADVLNATAQTAVLLEGAGKWKYPEETDGDKATNKEKERENENENE